MQLRHAREELAHPRVARCDRACGRNDARRLDEHRPARLVGKSELHHRLEIQIDNSRLVHVARVCRFDVPSEQIVEKRSGPVEIRSQAPGRREVLGEEGDVGYRAREHTAVGALRRDGRRIVRVAAPVGGRRRGTRAKDLLQCARQSRVVDRPADQCRVRRILKEADSTSHDGARSSYRSRKTSNLGCRSVAPRESEARAGIDVIRRAVVALSEHRLEVRIERRRRREFVPVETHAVLKLKVVAPLVGVTQRKSADELASAPDPRRELPAEGRRLLRLQVRQRVEREGAERVRLLIQRECISARLGGEFDPVLVAAAEPRELIGELGAGVRLARVHVRASAERHRLDARRSIREGRCYQHRAARHVEIWRSIIA